jgi:DNA (cytosine-5)-methyltransferase 1
MKITQLDLFSGIGGFHLGFERAGFKVTSYFSEIDKHAIAVYKNQFKNSTYVGSVTNLRGADLPKIDLITFGSPCQDFSLAGKRRGMEGERSSLIMEAIRLIKECRPRVFIWENVKGTFSSNAGEDFAAILQEFADTGGYRLEWQLLNTSWFLPQNRERIYLVGYIAEPRRNWTGVFPLREDTGEPCEIKQTASLTGGQLGRVLDPQGIGYALSACDYKDPMKVEVKSATASGYEEATVGDSINLTAPNSETRRGRVGQGKAQTLDTSCNQAVVQPVQLGQGMKTFAAQSGTLIGKEGQDAFTILSVQPNGVTDGYRIRRLTPIECERLQGFPDNHTAFGDYDGEVKPMSNSQRYKQCGNAVTVDVVKAVAERVKPLFK